MCNWVKDFDNFLDQQIDPKIHVFLFLSVNFCVNLHCNRVVVNIERFLYPIDLIIFRRPYYHGPVDLMFININCKIVPGIIGKTIISNFINRQVKNVRPTHFYIGKRISNPGALLNLWSGVVKVFNCALVIGLGHVSVGDRSNQ